MGHSSRREASDEIPIGEWKGPILVSPHGSGSLRYMDAVPFEDRILYYYEYARPDGSHELRVNTAPLEGSA